MSKKYKFLCEDHLLWMMKHADKKGEANFNFGRKAVTGMFYKNETRKSELLQGHRELEYKDKISFSKVTFLLVRLPSGRRSFNYLASKRFQKFFFTINRKKINYY